LLLANLGKNDTLAHDSPSVEITPEMIGAGINILVSSSRKFDMDETIVCCLFTAMANASPELKFRVKGHDWGMVEGVAREIEG
jgi:hypothetical protein